ncbi:MAG: sigma-70 family RNA polymerase sigma factor [Bacteroidota bacterium]
MESNEKEVLRSGLCEKQAFQKVFQTHARKLRNFIFAKSGNLQLAEDLTQEAFLRLWKKCAQIVSGKAASFLFKVAQNLFLDHVRHQKVVLDFQHLKGSSKTAEAPDFIFEMKEFQAKLERTINSMPEGSRVVFLMNRIEKMTYQEIADCLGISKKAVEKRMHRALLELRKIAVKV